MECKTTPVFRVVTIGSSSVGKTCIINKLINDDFSITEPSTTGASFLIKQLNVNNKEVHLQIWDTAGQERYRSLGPIYYRNSNAAVVVFSLVSKLSFNSMREWIDDFQNVVGTDSLIVVAGNKVDLLGEHQDDEIVSIDEAKRWAEDQGFKFFATSAFTGEGVSNMFQFVSEELVRMNQVNTQFTIDTNESAEQEPRKCCK